MPQYSRPLLTYALAGRIGRGALDWRADDYLEKALAVEVVRGARAASLRPDAGTVLLADGRELRYDALVVATGARAKGLEAPGADLPGVFTLRSAEDLDAIEALAKPGRHAIVVGGGNVGLQTAEALLERGLRVTVVFRSSHLLSQMVDAEAGRRTAALFAAHDVALRPGRDVAEIVGQGSVSAVRLDDGELVPADLVIVGKGITPNVEWLAGSGIEIRRGVVVDRSGRTNLPGVFAAGDCSETADPSSGDSAVAGIWPVAYEMGRAAGSAAVGVERPSAGALRLNASRFFGHTIVSIGEVREDRRPAGAGPGAGGRRATSTASSSIAASAWWARSSTATSRRPASSIVSIATPHPHRSDQGMSRIIATAAIRGAHACVARAEAMLKQAALRHGRDAAVGFPDTAYALPVILALTGRRVEKLADLEQALAEARGLAAGALPTENLWLPYLGDTLDAGTATLIAHEAMEALKPLLGTPLVEGFWLGPTSDAILREQGIKLVDGRMPGFAACVGALPDDETAEQLARDLQERNILVFMGRITSGETMAAQLQRRGVEMSWETFLVPYGKDTSSLVHALGFACRAAMTFGGLKPGGLAEAREILLYNQRRVFAFVLALGEVDDEKYATAAGAINFGFPVIADTDIPQILPSGICTYEHVVSNVSHEDMPARAVEVRGVKIQTVAIPIPVRHGPAFEGERVRKEDLAIEFGGKYNRAFEYLVSRPMDKVEDGLIARDRPRDHGRARGRAPAARHLRRGGRPQAAAGLRVDPGAPHPLVPVRADGRHAPRPARLGLAAHLQEDARRGLQGRAPGHGARAQAQERLPGDRRQGAGDPLHRAGPGRRALPRGDRGLHAAGRAHGRADRRDGRHLLLVRALPELRAEPRLHHHARAAGPVRRLQLAGRQGRLRDQPPRRQPAGQEGRRRRSRCSASGRASTTSCIATRTAPSSTSPPTP